MSDPYRTPGTPIEQRRPVGYCPRCGAKIWNKEEWVARGRSHPNCEGSTLARVMKERDRALEDMHANGHPATVTRRRREALAATAWVDEVEE